PLRVATQYKSYLLRRKKQNSKQMNTDGSVKESQSTLAKVTIQRNITALKVLFKYLAESSNNSINKPYLTHNIMQEITNVTDRQTLQARADLLEDKLFLGEETENYLQFISEIYPTELSTQAMKYYKRDRERD
ncbi:tyrosine recombinase XerS, partial [Enterococcus dongliensis]|nr:tyrosine recombinase XerS [Enterococcus dongliensis]